VAKNNYLFGYAKILMIPILVFINKISQSIITSANLISIVLYLPHLILGLFKFYYMNFIVAFFFIIAVTLLGILPFPLIYGLSNLVRFFIYRVFGYRKTVIQQNLRNSFPNITKDEVNRLTGLIYKNLSDVLLEGIKSFTISKLSIKKRHVIINPEVLEPLYKTGRNLIGVTAHYGNWEWGSLSASMNTNYKVVAFYKPLANKQIDWFVRWSRSRFGTTLASIRETSLTFENYKDERTIFLMASDQNAPKKYRDKVYWVKFLNQDTAFLHGLENHARFNNCPVVYVDVQRVKRGYYNVELTLLTDNPNELPVGKITELYAQKLESVILKKPENWLWSHRRWKLKRQV